MTTTEMLSALAAIFHKPFRPIHIPHALLRAVKPARWCLASACPFARPQIASAISIRPVLSVGWTGRESAWGFQRRSGLADGFAATAEWYQREGWV